MSIFAPLILCLLICSACGDPVATRSPFAIRSDRAPHLRMERFKMRYQAGSSRFVEITGDSAALLGSDRVNMDSVALTFYRDNLEFLRLTARNAQARTGATDSGAVTLAHAAGRLYYGGQFGAETLKISFEDGTWSSPGPAVFRRLPLDFSAGSAYGPISMEEVYARDAKIRSDGSSAFGDLMRFWTAQRLMFLRGRAGYVSDTISIRAEPLAIQIDPTYSRMSPVKFRGKD